MTNSNHLYKSFDGGKTWVDQNTLLQGIEEIGYRGMSGVSDIFEIAGFGIIVLGKNCSSSIY